MLADLLKPQHEVAARKACEQGAQEAGGNSLAGRFGERAAGSSHGTADETDEQAGTVGDGAANVAGEDGKHEAEADAADALEPCGDRRVGAEVAILRRAHDRVNEERERNEDAARDDEGQHVADAFHQVLVDLTADALVLGRLVGSLACTAGMRVNRGLAFDDLVDELFGLVDTVGDLGDQHRPAIEARHFDILVGGDDDAVACRDLVFGQDVLGAARTVGLDLDRDAHLLGLLIEGLGCHVGVRDARGARGDGEHADGAVVCGCGGCGRGGCIVSCFLGWLFLGKLLAFLVVDQLEEFLGAARGEQLVAPIDVHEHRHEAREHLEMHLAVARGGDHED